LALLDKLLLNILNIHSLVSPFSFYLHRDSFDDETKYKKRAIELNQGRAAQMGILALMVHEKLGVSILPNNAPFN